MFIQTLLGRLLASLWKEELAKKIIIIKMKKWKRWKQTKPPALNVKTRDDDGREKVRKWQKNQTKCKYIYMKVRLASCYGYRDDVDGEGCSFFGSPPPPQFVLISGIRFLFRWLKLSGVLLRLSQPGGLSGNPSVGSPAISRALDALTIRLLFSSQRWAFPPPPTPVVKKKKKKRQCKAIFPTQP